MVPGLKRLVPGLKKWFQTWGVQIAWNQ